MALGRHPELGADQFHMTTLPIRLAAFINGVSLEHGQVSRKMFHALWPERPVDEVPIQQRHQWSACSNVGCQGNGSVVSKISGI